MVNVGDRFGRLIVIGLDIEFTPIKRLPGCNQKRHIAICQCDCGSPQVRVRVDGLLKAEYSSRKPSRSCGCLQKEAVTKHGRWKNPLYTVWKGMHERCYNPADKRYAIYGGRGIRVCNRWHDIHAFIEDMQEGYRKNLQINRIDNDSGYFKGNCHWATRIEQAYNKSNTVRITFNGQSRSIRQWSIHLGINYGTLIERIRVLNWPIEKALTQPVRKGNYKL
jgi:hypothetical protein